MRHQEVRVLTDLADISTDAGLHGAAVSADKDNKKFKPLLGQEFLYNVNLIADMHGSETLKNATALRDKRDRARNYEADAALLQKQLDMDAKRVNKLNKLHKVLHRVSSKLDDESVKLSAICALIQTLYENFTEEFHEFGLIGIFPGLLSRKINGGSNSSSGSSGNDNGNAALSSWEPLSRQGPAHFVDLFDAFTALPRYFESKGQHSLAKQATSIFHQCTQGAFLTPIRRALTNEWSVHDPECAVRLITAAQL
jgi:hypothetical protein